MGIVRDKMTVAFIDSIIKSHEFLYPEKGTLTVCVLTMKTGSNVVGTSNVIDPANYNKEMGAKIALDNAKGKIWELEGYAIKRDLIYLVERAARTAHEANRLYCNSIGDHSQKFWDFCPDWQKDSARAGVKALIENPELTSAQLHESWMAEKETNGWVHGPVKDEETKEHPCMVPYNELPQEQRHKDMFFGTIVRSVIADVY